MTRPNPDTQGTAPTTVQGVQPQLMPGLDSFLHIQRARSPTVQGTHTQQHEKFTPLQRDNPMTRPNPDTQGTAHTTPDTPAQQNERITQPQKENPVPGPDSGTQRSTPPQGKDPINRPDPHNQSPAPPLPRVPPPIRMRDSHNPREKTWCQDQNQAPRESHPQQSEAPNPDKDHDTRHSNSTRSPHLTFADASNTTRDGIQHPFL